MFPSKNVSDIRSQLDDMRTAYEMGMPFVTDDEYDRLVEKYESLSGSKYQVVGATPIGETVKLPYYMGSIDTIKGLKSNRQLQKWKEKYPGADVITDKIDGISALYVITPGENDRLFTRGDGFNGSDISYIIPFLKLPKPSIEGKIAIRGEIAFSKEAFEEYVTEMKKQGSKNKLKKARNSVIGLINRRGPPWALPLLNFYAYQIVDWDYETFKQSLEISYLKFFGFQTPWAVVSNQTTLEVLESILKSRIRDAPYEIDGIVLRNEIQMIFPEGKNPPGVRAFKMDESFPSKVISIEWNPSKDGKLIPIVHIEPIEIQGSMIRKASGKNANDLISKGIGPGSKVMVSLGGGIIPDIVDVVTPTEVPMPSGVKWDENHVHLLIADPLKNESVQKKRMVHFVKTMNIRNLGPGRISALYDIGINTIGKLITSSSQEMMKAEKFGEKSAQKAYDNIHIAISNAPLHQVMVASGIFGPGFGIKKLEPITSKYPNILDYACSEKGTVVNLLNSIGGYNKTAHKFEEKLPQFVIWLNSNPSINIAEPLDPEEKIQSEPLAEYNILFTGFRDVNLSRKASLLGAEIKSGWSAKVNLLVVSNLSLSNSKVSKAKEKGIQIMDHESFKRIVLHYLPE